MDIQEPDFLKNMKGQDRWNWLDRQKEIMAEAIAENKAVEIKPETIKGFLYMSQVQDDKYCQLVSMHNNAVVVAACAAIEQDKDSSHDWLLNMLDQADCAEWQMYSNAQEFYDRNHLPFPLTQAEHRENMEKLKIIEKEDAEKFEIWYEQNVMAKLKAQEQKG